MPMCNLVGVTNAFNFAALDISTDGLLYTFSYTTPGFRPPPFCSIDPTDGTTVFLGNMRALDVVEGALAISPMGVAYGVGDETGSASQRPYLFRLGLPSGSLSRIGLIGNSAIDINGMAWRADGQLIAIDGVSNSFVLIDPNNASVTPFAPLNTQAGGAGGMTIAGGRGYFCTGSTLNGGSNELWTFDPFTGAHSRIGGWGSWIGNIGMAGLSARGRVTIDRTSIALSSGGSQNLDLCLPGKDGRIFIMMGSATGTSPGLDLGGNLLPLNVDTYTLFTLENTNSGVLVNSAGSLDRNAQATTTINIPRGLPNVLRGSDALPFVRRDRHSRQWLRSTSRATLFP